MVAVQARFIGTARARIVGPLLAAVVRRSDPRQRIAFGIPEFIVSGREQAGQREKHCRDKGQRGFEWHVFVPKKESCDQSTASIGYR
jgi:hypothetical protein